MQSLRNSFLLSFVLYSHLHNQLPLFHAHALSAHRLYAKLSHATYPYGVCSSHFDLFFHSRDGAINGVLYMTQFRKARVHVII
jgi:hypothetical protein